MPASSLEPSEVSAILLSEGHLILVRRTSGSWSLGYFDRPDASMHVDGTTLRLSFSVSGRIFRKSVEEDRVVYMQPAQMKLLLKDATIDPIWWWNHVPMMAIHVLPEFSLDNEAVERAIAMISGNI